MVLLFYYSFELAALCSSNIPRYFLDFAWNDVIVTARLKKYRYNDLFFNVLIYIYVNEVGSHEKQKNTHLIK